LDVLIAAVLIAVTAPVLLLCMLAVLLGSGRPVFFGHERVGLRGRPFRCWKLRTMKQGADRWLLADPDLYRRYADNGYKLPLDEDPRLTRLGPWLRRTYLDELPQLFNVLNGSMSLFGPRPIIADELHHYGDAAGELLAMKPGLLGEWTSRGRDRPPYPERSGLELSYVRARTLQRDIRILVRSIPALLRGQEEWWPAP
jgi:lipopolysaccharide/colanic/teichoic acid biosynthesis glycosyltransferase